MGFPEGRVLQNKKSTINNFKQGIEKKYYLPVLYSSCWIISQSHAGLHIVRGEKQRFTLIVVKMALNILFECHKTFAQF